MEQARVDTREMLRGLVPGTLILTPNKRLAARLRDEFAMLCEQQRGSAAVAPVVMPFDSWVLAEYRRAVLAGAMAPARLLHAYQERWLWGRAIRESGLAPELLANAAAVDLARSAYDRLAEWNVNITDNDLRTHFSSYVDSEVMLGWTDAFRGLLHSMSATVLADVKRALVSVYRESTTARCRYKSIVLFGFVDPTPIQLALIETYCSENQPARWVLPWQRPDRVGVVAADSEFDEIERCASWALETARDNPGKRIGVVFPDLMRQRNVVERIFLNYFEPLAFFPGSYAQGVGFNLSAGIPLAQLPLFNSFAATLELCFRGLTVAAAKDWLVSPYHGDLATERLERIQLAEKLRGSGLARVTLSDLAALVNWTPSRSAAVDTACGDFSERIHAVHNLLQTAGAWRRKPIARNTQEWLALFAEILGATGWLQACDALPAAAFQQQQRIGELADELAQGSGWFASLSAREMLDLLRSAGNESIYHVETQDYSVEVLGILEAASQSFDYLCVAGMTDANWPPQPSPHPFIPLDMQQELIMASASVERELEYAIDLTSGFIGAADELVFSYQSTVDETPCRLSPVVLECLHREGLVLEESGAATSAAHSDEPLVDVFPLPAPGEDWQYENDGQGLPLSGRLRSGLSMLEQQNNCPFQAYARSRLGLRRSIEVGVGFNRLERGVAVHGALEYFWQDLGSSAGLARQDDAALQELVAKAVEEGIVRALRSRFSKPAAAHIAVESQRLEQLLHWWVELEQERPPFEVLEVEQALTFALGELEVALRIDRVDRLMGEAGRQQELIIDYKTGEASSAELLSEPPRSLQLPVYQLALASGNVVGLSFATLKPGKIAYYGLSEQELGVPGIKLREDWAEINVRWRESIDLLADGIQRGDARVEPAFETSCKRCDLHSVCRIHQSITEEDAHAGDAEVSPA